MIQRCPTYVQDVDCHLCAAVTCLPSRAASASCCSQVFEEIALFGDAELASRVLGFTSTGTVVVMLIIFIFLMLIILAISTIIAIKNDGYVATLRISMTNTPPELTMGTGHSYMLFLSHIWVTAQDAVIYSTRTVCEYVESCDATCVSMPIT